MNPGASNATGKIAGRRRGRLSVMKPRESSQAQPGEIISGTSDEDAITAKTQLSPTSTLPKVEARISRRSAVSPSRLRALGSPPSKDSKESSNVFQSALGNCSESENFLSQGSNQGSVCDDNVCTFPFPSTVKPSTVKQETGPRASCRNDAQVGELDIMIFKASGCRACSEVIRALQEAGIPYGTVDLTLEPWRKYFDHLPALPYLICYILSSKHWKISSKHCPTRNPDFR